MIVLDGAYRGTLGRITSAGGGLVWVRLDGVAEALALPAASVEIATRPTSLLGSGKTPAP